jgi:hypothetical protein
VGNQIKVQKIGFLETKEEGYSHKAPFFIRDAFGDYIYYASRDRAKVQALVDSLYGKGKYTVRGSTDKKSKQLTARGSINGVSRKGSLQHKIFNSQGRF